MSRPWRRNANLHKYGFIIRALGALYEKIPINPNTLKCLLSSDMKHFSLCANLFSGICVPVIMEWPRTICAVTLILHMGMALYESYIRKRSVTLTSFPQPQGDLVSWAQDCHSPLVLKQGKENEIVCLYTIIRNSLFLRMCLTYPCTCTRKCWKSKVGNWNVNFPDAMHIIPVQQIHNVFDTWEFRYDSL